MTKNVKNKYVGLLEYKIYSYKQSLDFLLNKIEIYKNNIFSSGVSKGHYPVEDEHRYETFQREVLSDSSIDYMYKEADKIAKKLIEDEEKYMLYSMEEVA